LGIKLGKTRLPHCLSQSSLHTSTAQGENPKFDSTDFNDCDDDTERQVVSCAHGSADFAEPRRATLRKLRHQQHTLADHYRLI
jgi:hypothetical protein